MENFIGNFFSIGKKTTEPQKTLKYHEHPRKEVKITGRDYDEVMTDLYLPDTYFSPGQKVLSVGEGTSNFARTLKEKIGVESFAIDLIYALGSRLFDSKTREEAQNSINKNSQKTVCFIGRDQGPVMENAPINLRDGSIDVGRIAAADAAKLPFANECFDVVVADYLTLYIDLEKTIPELVRVLKPGGEIRLGGVGLRILLNNKIIDEDFYGNGINKLYSPALKMDEAFQWLGQQDDIYVWAVLDNVVYGYKNCDFNGIFLKELGEVPYSAGTIIIKKGSKELPKLGRMERVKQMMEDKRRYSATSTTTSTTLFDEYYPYMGQAVLLDMGVKENIVEKEGFFHRIKTKSITKKDGFFVKSLNSIFNEYWLSYLEANQELNNKKAKATTS